MPLIKHNQSDDDKQAKNNPALPFDLNTTHKLISLKQQIASSTQHVQARMDPVIELTDKIDRQALAELDKEFSNLISETNTLAEQVKKLSTIKVTPIEDRYKIAKQKVSLDLRPDLDNVLHAKHKKFFFVFEEALDNTSVINAYPHEATLFKVAVLFQLFLDDYALPRVIEMSIALRVADLPDHLKYIEKEGIALKANVFELAEQAHLEIINSPNENTRQRFESSYKKFKEIYLGLINPNKVDSDASQIDETKFPEIPDSLPLEGVTETGAKALPKQSNRNYYFFSGNEVATLQLLIPVHKNIIIPEISGIALDILMRASLTKQISIKNESSDIRKRTAKEKFILRSIDILSKAHATINEYKKGILLDAHKGHSGHCDDPLVILEGIDEECKIYKKELIINEDCKLSDSELTHAFFEMTIKSLRDFLASELKQLHDKYEKNKPKTALFDKIKLKSQYQQNQQRIKDKYHQYMTEMKNFKKIVEKIDPKNVMIFAAGAIATAFDTATTLRAFEASFSVPKDTLIHNVIVDTGFSPIPPLAL